MLAHLLVSKYLDHLPLYRQSAIYARDGIELDRSMLSDWAGHAVRLLQPIVEGIRRHVFAAEKIHGDDTPVPVLEPGLGLTRTGRFGPTAAATSSRCGRQRNRRSPRQGSTRSRLIYAIEDKGRFAPPSERLAHRVDTIPLIDAFFAWAETPERKLSASLAPAEALRYMIKRRSALTRFATDARLAADNNISENAIRPIALGRRNWLFAGSSTGGERRAAMYSILRTAKLNNLNPEPTSPIASPG